VDGVEEELEVRRHAKGVLGMLPAETLGLKRPAPHWFVSGSAFAHGHINADSQLGTWPLGAGFMDELRQRKSQTNMLCSASL
jgi:hypothetical protein